jgi:hypothetical protein
MVFEKRKAFIYIFQQIPILKLLTIYNSGNCELIFEMWLPENVQTIK